MKQFINYLAIAITGLTFLAGCDKVDDLPFYENGTAVTLSANKTAVVASAADSTTNVVSFNWTSPEYATDSSRYKFLIQIDSTGRNFAQATTKEIIGNR